MRTHGGHLVLLRFHRPYMLGLRNLCSVGPFLLRRLRLLTLLGCLILSFLRLLILLIPLLSRLILVLLVILKTIIGKCEGLWAQIGPFL